MVGDVGAAADVGPAAAATGAFVAGVSATAAGLAFMSLIPMSKPAVPTIRAPAATIAIRPADDRFGGVRDLTATTLSDPWLVEDGVPIVEGTLVTPAGFGATGPMTLFAAGEAAEIRVRSTDKAGAEDIFSPESGAEVGVTRRNTFGTVDCNPATRIHCRMACAKSGAD
jgi:hypothetical protein